METVLLMLCSFAFFTLGCWYLAHLVMKPAFAQHRGVYSRTALRFGRAYKIFAVSVCLILWFWALISAFWTIFQQPPF
jgi:hypothetical protein